MTNKTYFRVVGIIFLLISVLHLLRIIYGWTAVIGSWEIPLWLSWLALVIAGYLSYIGLKWSKQ